MTVKLNNEIAYFKNKNIFMSGMKYMGKSMSMLLMLILRGYLNESKNLLLPKSTI